MLSLLRGVGDLDEAKQGDLLQLLVRLVGLARGDNTRHCITD